MITFLTFFLHSLHIPFPDPEVQTDEGLTPLHYAARYVPIVQGDEPVEDSGTIHITLSSSSKQLMMLLVNHYFVDVTVTDIYGFTPLHYACARGNRAAAEILIQSGKVNLNALDKQLNTPLHGACRIGDAWIVEQLLEGGANVLLSNEEGVNPLHVSCQEGWCDVVNLIMRKRPGDHNQLVTRVDNEYNSALHLACGSGEAEIVRVLLLYNANPTITKLHDVSPLHIAAKEGYVEITDMLLQYEEITLNMRDEGLETPLHYAAKHSQEEMIHFLLNK